MIHFNKFLLSIRGKKKLSAAAMIELGDAARDQKEWNKASIAYKGALDQEPDLSDIWIQYAHVLKEDGRLDDAVAAYREAAGQHPSDAETHIHLGHLLKRIGRDAEAVQAFRQVLELNPSDSETIEELLMLGYKAPSNVAQNGRSKYLPKTPAQASATQVKTSQAVITPGWITQSDSSTDFGVVGQPGGRVAAWLRVPKSAPPQASAGLWINGVLAAVHPLPPAAGGSVVDLVFDPPGSVMRDVDLSASVGLITLDGAPASGHPLQLTYGSPSNAFQSNFTLPPVEPLKDFGIITFGFTRTYALELVLESLHRQGVSDITEVWIDGDQANPKTKEALASTHEMVARYPLAAVRANRGNFGFRKMVLLGLQHMVNTYKRFVVIEDDCFPTGQAAEVFYKTLCEVENDERIFSVYGHHFLTPSEGETCNRFQGWGWGTTAEKMRPLLNELIECFSMTEEEYLSFVDHALTPEIEGFINVTPSRQPVDTLRRFFAWDETLSLLAGRRGLVHKPTQPRVIYNFGAGKDSTHFSNVDWYRKPPFNMISPDEVWDVF